MKNNTGKSAVLVLGLIFILFSCDKTSIVPPEIRIILPDDVSPIRVKFEVEDIYDSYDWRYDEVWASGETPTNVNQFSFSEGSHKVSLTVIKGLEQVTVEKYFTVPGIAHTLKIEGIDLNDIPDAFSFGEGRLHIQFDSFPGAQAGYIHRYLDYNETNNSRKYLFDSPVVYDVYEYLTDTQSYGDYVYCTIYRGEYDEDLFTGQLKFCLAYTQDRIYNDERAGDTQIMSLRSGKSILLLSNWMPE